MKKLEGREPNPRNITTDSNRKNIPVRVIRNTSQGIIPSHESGEEREETSGLNNWWVGRTGRVTVEIPNAKEHEGHVEREEKGEEGDG